MLDHVEQQDRGLDKLQIATAAMDVANGEGEKTKKVLLPLIKASKCCKVYFAYSVKYMNGRSPRNFRFNNKG